MASEDVKKCHNVLRLPFESFLQNRLEFFSMIVSG